MQPDDLALRCNIISLAEGRIKNHHGGHLSTADGTLLIEYLQEHLGSDRVKFIPGIQYRHLLVIKGETNIYHVPLPTTMLKNRGCHSSPLLKRITATMKTG